MSEPPTKRRKWAGVGALAFSAYLLSFAAFSTMAEMGLPGRPGHWWDVWVIIFYLPLFLLSNLIKSPVQ